VTYRDHPSALMAMQKLGQQKLVLEGQIVTGSLAIAEQRPDDLRSYLDSNESRTLFVKNVTQNVGEAALRQAFSSGTEQNIDRIVIPLDFNTKNHLGHAFLYFSSRREAELAKDRCSGMHLDGKPLEVEWCKPKPRNPAVGRGRGLPTWYDVSMSAYHFDT